MTLLSSLLTPTPTDDVTAAVLALTNARRAEHRLAPLKHSRKLDHVATIHTRNMIAHRFLDHVDQDGRSPQDRLQLLHPELIGLAGENLALASTSPAALLAERLVDGWMKSPGHRLNILDRRSSHLGVAVARAGAQIVATQCCGLLTLELIAPRPLVRLRPERSCSLRFAWLGGIPRHDLQLVLQSPRGDRSVDLIWRGEICEVILPAPLEPGTCRLTAGYRSTSAPTPGGLSIVVSA